ncbi:hypothetical protein B0H10DRAFT_1968889 [Mycena sp. CBHHK59/15]|nr:hypothetical protein B0H10DRAFT_1968889 [Mycena sp. CBHHK59/15]
MVSTILTLSSIRVPGVKFSELYIFVKDEILIIQGQRVPRHRPGPHPSLPPTPTINRSHRPKLSFFRPTALAIEEFNYGKSFSGTIYASELALPPQIFAHVKAIKKLKRSSTSAAAMPPVFYYNDWPLSKSLPRRPTLLKSSPDAVAFNVVCNLRVPLSYLQRWLIRNQKREIELGKTQVLARQICRVGRFPKGLIAVFRPCVGNFKGAYLLNYGKFSQALRLPPGTTAASIRAGLSDGLLTITWPRIIKAETSQNLHPAQISQNE